MTDNIIIKDASGNNQTIRTTDNSGVNTPIHAIELGTSLVSSSNPFPVNQSGVSATGTLGVLNATVALSLTGSTGFAVDLRGTFVATVTFQGTIDGTNWFTIAVIPAGSGANIASVTTATAAGAWVGNANGMQQVRAIATAYTSGTVTVTLRAMQATGVTFNMPSGVTTQSVSGTVTANAGTGTFTSGGVAAHAAAISGNPVRLGGRALTANYTAVATGQTADLTTTLVGALIQKPYAIPEADWQYAAAASGIVNTTTAVTVRAAQAAGIRNYITGIQIMAQPLGAATELAVRDGAAGTVIWRTHIPAGGLPTTDINFPTPLRGTAATLLEVVTLTASVTGAVYFNAQGYSAP